MTTGVFGRAALAGVVGLLCVSALASPRKLHVIFVDGGSLEVEACTVEEEQAVLTLPGGGTLTVPASRVLGVEGLLSEESDSTPAGRARDARAAHSEEATPVTSIEGREAPRLPTIESIIETAAARYELEPQLLAAVIAVESGYRSDAVSPKGAQGLMQLMPATARELSVEDPFDPEQNIDGGARYLKQLLEKHGDSFVEALAAYNAGAGRVARFNGIPPYRETIDYIRRVLEQYEIRLAQ